MTGSKLNLWYTQLRGLYPASLCNPIMIIEDVTRYPEDTELNPLYGIFLRRFYTGYLYYRTYSDK